MTSVPAIDRRTGKRPSRPPLTLPLPHNVKSLTANAVWMIVGHVVFGVCQWGIFVVVARLGSVEMLGQFAFAMAITTPIVLLANLDLRTVQATDQTDRYPVGDYISLRIWTTAIAFVVVCGVAWSIAGNGAAASVVVAIGAAKCAEALSDLSYGFLQQHERLDRMSQSRILRGVGSFIVLAVTLRVTHNLSLAAAAYAISWLVALACCDLVMSARLLASHGKRLRIALRPSRGILRLALASLPVGLYSVAVALEFSLPRLCISNRLGDAALGVYAAIYSLVFVPMTVINAIHSAALPRLARLHRQFDWLSIHRLTFRLFGLGILVGLVGILGTYLFGGTALKIFYGREYAAYAHVFVVLMLAAAMRFVSQAAVTVVRAAQRFWLILGVQVGTIVMLLPTVIWFIGRWQFAGAAYAICLISVANAATQFLVAAAVRRNCKH